jgi:hypothetical protein
MVAQTFRKRHDDVLKAIRKLDCSADFNLRNLRSWNLLRKMVFRWSRAALIVKRILQPQLLLSYNDRGREMPIASEVCKFLGYVKPENAVVKMR